VIDPQQVFWQWFDAHQDELFNFETDQERVFDELSQQLIQVHPDLTFEFGPKTDRREFVISAGGIRGAFPAVSSLVAAAPTLDRWRVTAFRPRRTPLNSVQLAETCIDPSDVEFSLLTKGSVIGIQVFIPGFRESDLTLKQIGYLMLDDALGEYDVETKIGLIQMLPPEAPRTYRRYPFSELPSLFDQLASQLAGPLKPN
jgi:hypothetical protein